MFAGRDRILNLLYCSLAWHCGHFTYHFARIGSVHTWILVGSKCDTPSLPKLLSPRPNTVLVQQLPNIFISPSLYNSQDRLRTRVRLKCTSSPQRIRTPCQICRHQTRVDGPNFGAKFMLQLLRVACREHVQRCFARTIGYC